jgi:hypothetical protein
MSPPVLVFAAQWQEQLQEIHDKVPEYLAKARVPILPDPPGMPELSIPADVAIILGAIAILIALWRLLTLRIFRAFFALIAALLIAYYPAAYGFHYWLDYSNLKGKIDDGAAAPWETKVWEHRRYIDWGIMGGGVLIGVALLYASRPRRQRWDEKEHEEEETQQRPPPWQQQQPSPRGRGGQGGGRSPFDFS